MSTTGMVFEWDERKRSRNLHKHGLDFKDCAEVFAGPTTSRIDARYDYGETRFKTLGLLDGRVVEIVHAVSGEFVRIISLRKASKNEQAQYFQTIPN
jgi:uncharacterized DUF497 family protein